MPQICLNCLNFRGPLHCSSTWNILFNINPSLLSSFDANVHSSARSSLKLQFPRTLHITLSLFYFSPQHLSLSKVMYFLFTYFVVYLHHYNVHSLKEQIFVFVILCFFSAPRTSSVTHTRCSLIFIEWTNKLFFWKKIKIHKPNFTVWHI